MIAGRAPTIEAGIALARDVVASGQARAWLEQLRAFAHAHARKAP
jgi:anthranilate phosphoribosyltransferase